MSFVDATGLTQAVAEIKAFCTNVFAALTHYHTSLGSSSETVVSVSTSTESVAESDGALGSFASKAHAEGNGATANGVAVHAEGSSSSASGTASHAEGNWTVATSTGSHAEGGYSWAKANYAHAEGHGTRALSAAQHAAGKYNVADSSGEYAEIVGNGSSDNDRSNARTLDWDGNAWHAGEVTATETVTSGGTTTTKSHNLTEKADMAVVESRSKCWYGQCDTGASVAAKVVTCSGFELVKGAMIAVHFAYGNTADEATLNVNSTGAKYIATGNTISGQDNFWYAGEIVMFTYDGTYWRPANMAGINALRESVSTLVTTRELNAPALVTVPPYNTTDATVQIEQVSGYKPIGVCLFSTGSRAINFVAITFNSAKTYITYILMNTGGAEQRSQPYFVVLYLKNL